MYDQIKSGDVGKLRMIKLLARELPAWINVDYLKSSGKSYWLGKTKYRNVKFAVVTKQTTKLVKQIFVT